MKKKLFKLLMIIAIGSLSLLGCKKSESVADQLIEDSPVSSVKKYSRIDTTTVTLNKTSIKYGSSKMLAVMVANASEQTYIQVNYMGSGSYDITGGGYTWPNNLIVTQCHLYKDGAIYESEGSFIGKSISFRRNLPPGRYYLSFTFYNSAYTTPTFVIVPTPQPPAGMIGIYEYLNPTNGQHICSADWEEIGSTAWNWVYERTLGYIYPSASSAPNLKAIYRYYRAGTGSHYTTDQTYGNFTDWQLYAPDKTMGYVSISPVPGMDRPLTKWYSAALDDHYVCIPPVVPEASSLNYVQDSDSFIFGYIQ